MIVNFLQFKRRCKLDNKKFSRKQMILILGFGYALSNFKEKVEENANRLFDSLLDIRQGGCGKFFLFSYVA